MSSLSAQGTNNFPDNYSDVRREFISLTSEAIAPWKEEYEAGTGNSGTSAKDFTYVVGNNSE